MVNGSFGGRDRAGSVQRGSKYGRDNRDDHPLRRFIFDFLRFARSHRRDHESGRWIPVVFFHQPAGWDDDRHDHDLRLTGAPEQLDSRAGAALQPQRDVDASATRRSSGAVFLSRHVIIRVVRRRGPFRPLGLHSFSNAAHFSRTSVRDLSLVSFALAATSSRPDKISRTC